jgi:short-subunit dehydrogenase
MQPVHEERPTIMRKLRGKRALVTGAASGIGRAIAVRLAEEGVRLFLLDVDEAGLANIVAEARREGVEAIGRRCDVGEPAEISAAVAAVLERWGGVDILVNNAGITYYGHTDRMSAEHWDQVLRVNLHSHVQFTRELLPSLLARREAHVLNVASILGLVGMPKVSAYCTTKFALVGFSQSLRAEFAREGLGVTVLCPGFVRTNLFASAPLEESAAEHKAPPELMCMAPERVAAAAIKAIRRNRPLVVLGPLARLLYGVERFMPWVMDLAFHLGRRKRVERKLARLAAQTPLQTPPFPQPAIIEQPAA